MLVLAELLIQPAELRRGLCPATGLPIYPIGLLRRSIGHVEHGMCRDPG